MKQFKPKTFRNFKEINWLLIAIVIGIVWFATSSREDIIGDKMFLFEQLYDEGELESSHSLSIGDSVFSTSHVTYNCVNKIPSDINGVSTRQSTPAKDYNEPSCWTATLTYEGKSYTFNLGQTQQISPYLNAKFDLVASYHKDEKKMDYEDMRYYITLANKDILQVTLQDDSTILLNNQLEDTPAIIRNDIAENIQGGIVIKTNYAKLQNYVKSEEIPLTLKKGTNVYNIQLDTSILGRQDIAMQPYIIIDDQKIYDDRVSYIAYNVVQYISDIQKTECATSILCPVGYECATLKINNQEKQMCIQKTNFIPDIGDTTKPFIEVNTSIWVYIILAILIGLLIFKYTARIRRK